MHRSGREIWPYHLQNIRNLPAKRASGPHDPEWRFSVHKVCVARNRENVTLGTVL